MKLIFESLNATRVKGEVCKETAILTCMQDIKNIVREATEETEKEEKKGLGTRTVEMLKLGYKKAVELLMKIINAINDFRKKVWSKIKGGEKAKSDNVNKDSQESNKQSSTAPNNSVPAIGYKTYEIYDCTKHKGNVDSLINTIIDKDILSKMKDNSEKNKKIDELFFEQMFGVKGITSYNELPKTQANINEIDKAIKFLQDQANSLVRIIKTNEKKLNDPRMKDEFLKEVSTESLLCANRIAANIANLLSHLLSKFKK